MKHTRYLTPYTLMKFGGFPEPLLKACHFWTDIGKGSFELFYLRDKDRSCCFQVVQAPCPQKIWQDEQANFASAFRNAAHHQI